MTIKELSELSKKLECEICRNMYETNDRDNLVALYLEAKDIEDMIYKKLHVNARNYWLMSALYDLAISISLDLLDMIKNK